MLQEEEPASFDTYVGRFLVGSVAVTEPVLYGMLFPFAHEQFRWWLSCRHHFSGMMKCI